MGRRGPPPKPTALKKLQGTYRPDRAARNEVTPQLGEPPCPRSLTGEARAEWRRVAPELVRLQVLAIVDAGRLADYCRAHALAIKAAGKAAQQGEVIETERGPARNPWHVIAQEARAQARLLAQEFGLTPSSRSRVEAPPAEAADEYAAMEATLAAGVRDRLVLVAGKESA